MKKLIFFLALCGLVGASAAAQGKRAAVSAAEVTGTFRTDGGDSEFKIAALGRGHLKVEFFGSVKLGREGNVYTGEAAGLALIEGDTAIFVPDGQEPDQCSIKLIFTKPGSLKVVQEGEGGCGFGLNVTADGVYKKASGAKPKFKDPE
jgi:hypothetical protein